MARAVYSNPLRNRTNRLRLVQRKKPYKTLISPGVHLCYRRNEGAGTWSVQAGWLKRFALADDHEEANGKTVMNFFEASQAALKLARGNEDSGKPVTVAEAVEAYKTDLQQRGAAVYNASLVQKHLPSDLASKTVLVLKDTDLRKWHSELVSPKFKLSSANRVAKSMKAALRLAATRDKRINNAHAWRVGLKPLKPAKEVSKAKGVKAKVAVRDNYWINDQTVNAIIAGCYEEGADFGAIIHTLAETGTRESQALKLYPADVITKKDGKPVPPKLLLWTSNKGDPDRTEEQRAVAISPKLAKVLQERAVARGPNEPLFDRLWGMSARFRVVLKRLGLDETLTPYTLRHSSIIRQIFANKPLRLVAFDHDTSVAEIERTYGRYLELAKAEDEAMSRVGMLADTSADNVVQLAS